MANYKLKYITKFSAESGLHSSFFLFLSAVASGLKGVLKNFVIYFNLSRDKIYF
jgi:hypothetical protein